MPAVALPGPVWLIGCGNMAGAMLDGWLGAGIDPGRITVVRPSGRPVAPSVRVLTDLPEDEVPALVLLGVKPQMLDAVAPRLAPVLDPETILVSILAGVEQASLRARFPAPRTIVKAMPNMPVKLGKGVIPLFSDSGDGAAKALVADLTATLGTALWFDDEQLFQAAGALTGAGPAFVFRFIDALAEGGTALGLPYEQSLRLALLLVEGSGAYAAGEAESPHALAARVASPRGTTEAGLAVLDADDGLKPLVLRTLEAARRRGRELAEAARAG